MTDITADEYRTAAKVLRANMEWRDQMRAAECEQEAARLEAEAARDEEAETLAKLHRAVLSDSVYTRWEDLDATARDLSVAAIRAVLDQLAADGRLLPEGGTVLDAGQWAMVRTLIEASHRKPEVQRAADRLRDEFKVGRCRCGGMIAEPSPGCEWHAAREVTPPAVSVPDDAPDGTPEKPWPTWQDVPDDVVYQDRHGWRYINQGRVRHAVAAHGGVGHPSAYTDDDMQHLAPFVRVDGDKA